MARPDEAFFPLEFITEEFDGSAAKPTGVLVLPFAPAWIIQKIIEGGLIAFGFQILRHVPNDAEAILNGDQQVYAGILREYSHGGQRHLRNSGRINEGDDKGGGVKFQPP